MSLPEAIYPAIRKVLGDIEERMESSEVTVEIPGTKTRWRLTASRVHAMLRVDIATIESEEL